MPARDLPALQSALGYQFHQPGLLRRALTHRSLLNEQGGSPLESYERLEFLGDSALGLAVSWELYRRRPEAPEGELTKLRSALVRGETLARAARRLNLGDYLALGRGEEETGGRERDTNLAAALEAVIAAVLLDSDFDEARRLALRLLAEELAALSPQSAPPENPKGRLQEYLQGLGRPAPRYRELGRAGPDHSPVFTVAALVGEEVIATGTGSRKADAEQAAARAALEKLAPEE